MTDIDASFAALGPPGFLGRASVWAKDLPLLDVRAALLETAGLHERSEEGRRLLERNPGAEEALAPVAAAGGSDRRLALKAQELSVSEFELAGLAALDDAWTAFAYSPNGTLNAYRAGDRLADGTVRAVASTDALLETEEGPLRIPISHPH